MTKANNTTNTTRRGPKLVTRSEIIRRSKEKHGDAFDYSGIPQDAKGADYRIKIKCNVCLHTFNRRARDHYKTNKGCPECSRKILDRTEIIRRATQKHGQKYDYSGVAKDAKGSNYRIKIKCNTCLTVFYQRASNHFRQGSGCPKCGEYYQINRDEIIKRCIKKHGRAFDYSEVARSAKGSRCKIKIKCNSCLKYFYTKAIHHYFDGTGCPHCAMEATAGWRRSRFIRSAQRRHEGQARLYLIKCQDKKEQFYKIGITARNTNERFKHSHQMPYDFEVLKEITGEAGAIYDMETQFHRMNREHHYQPKKPFGGSALECFSEINPDALFLFDVL